MLALSKESALTKQAIGRLRNDGRIPDFLPQLEGSYEAKEKALTKTNALFSEQIAMRAGSNQRQDKSIVLNLVDEEPIRLDVTFSE